MRGSAIPLSCNVSRSLHDFPTTAVIGDTSTGNRARRHLTRKQRHELNAQQLKETPAHSDRAVADGLGVHHTTPSRLFAATLKHLATWLN